ncbi:MAG TPA: alpha/beta family hydrolase [Bauldia sp.]|nr:alpha/beta family hydrolase [Bauldia sp.]
MATTKADAEPITISLPDGQAVSGLLSAPKGARAVYVLAHGAGAGMAHPFLAKMSALLSGHGIAVLRYQFPYMEKKGRRPDRPEVAEAAVAAAVAEAHKLLPALPIFAGGKSFGGRMTSNAEAHVRLAVRGLVFLGFPLHPPGAPADTRAAHLKDVAVPMLFLQGTNDDFASPDLLRPVVRRLGKRATLHWVDGANHSFHVPKSSGRTDADVMAGLADTISRWIDAVLAAPASG